TATAELDAGSLAVELRSVNHRYLDLQLRVPDEMRLLEPMLRTAITEQLTRGKVECRINYTARQAGEHPAQLNHTLLQQLARWNNQVQTVLPHAASLSVADVLRWHGVLHSSVLPAATLHTTVQQLLLQAVQEFHAARAREGEKLKDFLEQRVAQIATLRSAVAPHIPVAIAAYETKLVTRLHLAMQSYDDDRVRQEISLFASKIDLDEELSRLQTHLTEMKRILAEGGVVGKRLDFVVQELHREANTLGAKSVDIEVSRIAMEMKLLIEQMREQIQNIE
ncbi:MAG: YicC/YloC family endoribonuclease, partial [Gallionellaceae bacterium]|nr:YicC/YloC family endoribonuclease [Gallionellaceae bacterium]